MDPLTLPYQNIVTVSSVYLVKAETYGYERKNMYPGVTRQYCKMLTIFSSFTIASE